MAAIVEPKTPESVSSRGIPAPQSLKERLHLHLGAQRQPGEVIRITSVGPRHFRVNWLSPTLPAGEALVTRTYRLTRSQFLRVEENIDGQLQLIDQTRN